MILGMNVLIVRKFYLNVYYKKKEIMYLHINDLQKLADYLEEKVHPVDSSDDAELLLYVCTLEKNHE